MPARVESVDTSDGMARFALEGVRMRDIVGRARADLRPGDRVHLSVRPEAIRIRDRGEASGGSEDGVVTLPA
jgi:hypothetical protein